MILSGECCCAIWCRCDDSKIRCCQYGDSQVCAVWYSNTYLSLSSSDTGGGRVERRCWVNFQCRGVLLVWMTVGQGPIALAVGAGGGCLDIFSLIYLFSFLSPSLWETARYGLKYCLKGPLNPKQPTNQRPTRVERREKKVGMTKGD